MNKKGNSVVFIAIIAIILVILVLLLLAPNLVLDGRAMAPPPVIHPQPPSAVCGNGDCEGSEDYQDCPEDCCGEEGDQVRTINSCCEGLTAVEDICEFEWPEEEREVTLPVLPPPPPPSTDAIKEFFTGTGAAVAPPATPPVEPPSMCWFCVNCGDGICSSHETYENCGIDCAVCGNGICEPPNETYNNCPQDCCAEAGYRGPAKVTCCEGLKNIDPCDVEPQPDYCWITIMQEACINCGDGKCDLYETPENCPQDCIGNVTSCDELPPLEIDALDRDHTLKFTWEPDTIIPNSKLYLKGSEDCVGNKCHFGAETLIMAAYQPGSPGEYSIDMPQNNLQFYQITGKIRIGPKEGNCEPQCLFQGTRGEGWYDPCVEPEPKLFKYDDTCSEKEVSCCFIGTRSEGFYEVDCDEANENNVISYDNTCHLGAKLCEQPSNLVVKYDQEFNRPGRATAMTGINWMWYLNIEGVKDTRDLLNMGVFDYAAYWDAEEQKQVGSARGDIHMVCKPCGKGDVCCNPEYVITGMFDLDKGKPYFVSLAGTDPWKSTFVGDVPEAIQFSLVGNPSGTVNYIALPLNTKYKKAVDICNGLNLGNDITVGAWDINTQDFLYGAPVPCADIKEGIGNFNTEPGGIYYIGGLIENRVWTQE